ncbi:MAG: glutamate-cysteine ligase family protein, partial [Gammaproteobacteria bacterium]|nr:glutamate-cysteine ligase family protein [Gammaproteobacteria bacterium]
MSIIDHAIGQNDSWRMTFSREDLTIGVEEEYLLVDLETRDLVNDPPPGLMKACFERSGEQVSPELMRSQIEVGTKVCHSIQDAQADLTRLRNIIIDVCSDFGCAPIAVSTHPFARWQEQKQTEKERYDELTHEMQAAARRLLICGMHTHV